MKLVLAVFLLLTIQCVVFAQNDATLKPQPSTESTSPKPNSEDLVKLLKLQNDQKQMVINLQDLAARFDQVKKQKETLDQQIAIWVEEQAKKLKVDLTRFTFNIDTLTFVEKPKEQKPQ